MRKPRTEKKLQRQGTLSSRVYVYAACCTPARPLPCTPHPGGTFPDDGSISRVDVRVPPFTALLFTRTRMTAMAPRLAESREKWRKTEGESMYPSSSFSYSSPHGLLARCKLLVGLIRVSSTRRIIPRNPAFRLFRDESSRDRADPARVRLLRYASYKVIIIIIIIIIIVITCRRTPARRSATHCYVVSSFSPFSVTQAPACRQTPIAQLGDSSLELSVGIMSMNEPTVGRQVLAHGPKGKHRSATLSTVLGFRVGTNGRTPASRC